MSADRSKIESAPGSDPGHGNGRVVGTGARSGRGPVGGIGSIRRIRQALRYRIAMAFAWVAVRALFRVRVEGRDRLPPGPALLCFNHQSWVDPFVLMATLPWRPRLYFFGPKEEDMSRGGRNRIMTWTGTTIPFKPGKNDLIEATRRVGAAFEAGGVVAIAGEGRIHDGERELFPLNEGAAFFALRSKVPLVPVAINGTSWLAFGRRIRIRVGEPIAPTGRPTREAVEELSQRAWTALHELVADYPDPIPPLTGSGWYRFTEAFNEWPEGSRPAGPTRAVGSAAGASGAMGEAVAAEDTGGVPEKGGEDPTDH